MLKCFPNNISQRRQTEQYSRKHSNFQMFPQQCLPRVDKLGNIRGNIAITAKFPQQCFPGWTNWEIFEET